MINNISVIFFCFRKNLSMVCHYIHLNYRKAVQLIPTVLVLSFSILLRPYPLPLCIQLRQFEGNFNPWVWPHRKPPIPVIPLTLVPCPTVYTTLYRGNFVAMFNLIFIVSWVYKTNNVAHCCFHYKNITFLENPRCETVW